MKSFLFVMIMLLVVTGSLVGSQKDEGFAYFFDCAGNYLKVALISGRVVDKGFLPEKIGRNLMLSRVRDGCLVHKAKYDHKKNILTLKVQTEVWADEFGNTPTDDMHFSLPGFALIEDLKQDDRDTWRGKVMKSYFYKDESVMNCISELPFSSAYCLMTPDQKNVLFAERKTDVNQGSQSYPAVLRIDWDIKMVLSLPQPISGHFVIYDLVADSLSAKYTIEGIRTDLQRRTFMNTDGSVIFHAHNDEKGERKLFEVRTKPTLMVFEIEMGDFDPWWSVGILADR